MDSAMFSQLPPSGVYSGMTPWAQSQSTISGVLWPARLSQTSRSRSGGRSAGRVKGAARPSCHSRHAARFVVGSSGVAAGSAATIGVSVSFSRPCRTAFVPLVTGRRRTRPVAGWNRVRILAVPPRTYSCGRVAGRPCGRQRPPGCGTAWNGPASSSHQTAKPRAEPSV
jgi:hypothetical protein